MQYQEGDLRLISYGSRTLIPSEKKYHSSKSEFSGAKWAVVCDQYRDYLYYASHFHIYTDSNPVTFIMFTEKLTATNRRWVNEQAELFFAIYYKLGKQNIIADTLSRTSEQTHLEHKQFCTQAVPVEMVKTLLDGSNLTQEICLSQHSKYQEKDKYLKRLYNSKKMFHN